MLEIMFFLIHGDNSTHFVPIFWGELQGISENARYLAGNGRVRRTVYSFYSDEFLMPANQTG